MRTSHRHQQLSHARTCMVDAGLGSRQPPRLAILVAAAVRTHKTLCAKRAWLARARVPMVLPQIPQITRGQRSRCNLHTRGGRYGASWPRLAVTGRRR